MSDVPSAFHIVKVQTPPDTQQLSAGLLVYDEKKEHVSTVGATQRLMTMLNGDPKGYFRAVWLASENAWQIAERVSAQAW